MSDQRQACLVLGVLTVCGQVNYFRMYLATHSVFCTQWNGKMSTSRWYPVL